MSVTLVVARYQESLSWLPWRSDTIPWRIVVLDKGGDCSRADAIQLENVGREAHSFAYWNYLTATGQQPQTEWTVFAQGNPFDHCGDMFGVAKAIISRGDRLGWLGFHYDTAWNTPPYTPSDLRLADVWRSLFPGTPPKHRLSFPAGAQVVCHRSAIEFRSAEFWERCVALLATGDWTVPHAFERLWPTIYDGETT